ncbi:hypothetical protein QQF64_000485 [Cirrhinus molitorella]|uniref:Uncharacterized protein n=1 Tax=Cirrhinus molitorella TaxID=172907 RepID=A0ABR3NXY6_9TELE
MNITDLQESDTGIYWCAVKRSVRDTYDKVTLTVSKDSNESITIPTQPYKESQTCLDLHTTTTAAHSDSSSTTASVTSRDSNPDALKLSTFTTVSAHTSKYVVGCLVIAAILCLVGLATAHQCRKTAETSESCATATPVNRSNTCEVVDENSIEMKSTDKTKGEKCHPVSVYQNLNLNLVQLNEVYGNL